MRILFVCVGNTCRSQMAEGWAKSLGFDSRSAGTNTFKSTVAENAIKVMAEKGIDISKQKPQHLDEFNIEEFDLIISMGCGVQCPNVKIDEDWGLQDPVGQSISMYREVRDEIHSRLLLLKK